MHEIKWEIHRIPEEEMKVIWEKSQQRSKHARRRRPQVPIMAVELLSEADDEYSQHIDRRRHSMLRTLDKPMIPKTVLPRDLKQEIQNRARQEKRLLRRWGEKRYQASLVIRRFIQRTLQQHHFADTVEHIRICKIRRPIKEREEIDRPFTAQESLRILQTYNPEVFRDTTRQNTGQSSWSIRPEAMHHLIRPRTSHRNDRMGNIQLERPSTSWQAEKLHQRTILTGLSTSRSQELD